LPRRSAPLSVAEAQQPRTLKMQSSWPAGIAAQDHFRIFADRLDKISSGSLKVEVLAAGRSCRRSRCSTPRTRR
jgi:TRAP-type mannitol/chloroaromatic compound transport system substrate-binding protein